MAKTSDSGGRDPRPWQIGVLSGLLLYGVAFLDFEVSLARAAVIVGSALGAQALCTWLWGLPRFDPRSALISGLSLSLLLRTDSLALAAAAGAVAVLGKFALRWRGKHLWNPSCFALVACMACTDAAWVSAGQWGSAALFGFAMAGLGMLVIFRTARSDVTWAFLASYAALLFGRALWLGDPLEIPLRGLQSGALLLFAFFMISDPKTIPDSRPGRLLFAFAVAAGALFVQFGLYHTDPLLWSLAAAAPAVPLLDRWLPGRRYVWGARAARSLPEMLPQRKENPMRAPNPALLASLLAILLALPSGDALAFCGFYVGKADTKLFNQASQVVLVRDGDRTIVTMSNDFRGDVDEFATVIPVPTFLEREQIHVGERAVIEHLDAYTAPRLVEYFDPDPCRQVWPEAAGVFDRMLRKSAVLEAEAARAEGVHIEASYSVGEYDILILSAEQSNGLARWLRREGYRLPRGAERVLSSYIKQDMHFFVAKVNLQRHQELGFAYLRPLQVAYESPKFILPIRLGTLNADGTQDLFVYALTRKGRVETTNYRTVKLPTGAELPGYVKEDFGAFYTALFARQTEKEDMRVVFTEYAWDMSWCDPCAADPLSPEELRGLGVFWVGPDAARGSAPRDVFVTRLHLRYDAEHFPADLVFQETGDRTNFQGRYVLRHAFQGEATCSAADAYRRSVRERQEREAQTLASLTGWELAEIRRRQGLDRPGAEPGSAPWWQRLWGE